MSSNLKTAHNETGLVNGPSQCYIYDLPEEMVVRILSFCKYKDVVVFASTCKRFRNVLSNSTKLQLYIELEANGLQLASDCAPEDLNDLPSLMNKLKRYRNAWLDLDIGLPVEQDCGEDPMILWELRDGVFAKAFSSLGLDSDPNSVLIVPLGSQNHNTPLTFDFIFDEFTMDPSQELILFAGGNSQLSTRGWVRLCSSVTGKAHPQAKYHILSVDLGFHVPVNLVFNLTLEVRGDLIATKFVSSSQLAYEILVWNWKMGILINRIGCDAGIARFIFLDDERLIVWSAGQTPTSPVLTSVSLLVYDLDVTGLGYSFPNNGIINVSSLPKLAPSFAFRFPKLHRNTGVTFRGFLLRSDYGSQSGSLSPSVPFANSRALTLGLAMNVTRVGATHGTTHPLRIFVNTSRLIGQMANAKEQNLSGLDWKDWGEYTTRWFQMEQPNDWICWMFGSRYVRGDEYLSVIDFNTVATRRFLHRQQDNYVPIEQTDESTAKRAKRIDKGTWLDVLDQDLDIGSGWPDESSSAAVSEDAVVVDVVTSQDATNIPYFGEPVISRLPYRITTRARRIEPHGNWLISENYLVGIGEEFGFGSSLNEMMVYTIRDPNKALNSSP